jgi:hypothetical protein
MSDLISRQAAIDAILAVTGNSSVRELYEHVQEHGLSEMWSGGVNAAIDIIIAVPSAQQWVPCSERLPEVDREILVTEKSGFIRHCEYANYGDFQEFQTVEEGLTVPDVIAWMPLPPIFKEE